MTRIFTEGFEMGEMDKNFEASGGGWIGLQSNKPGMSPNYLWVAGSWVGKNISPIPEIYVRFRFAFDGVRLDDNHLALCGGGAEMSKIFTRNVNGIGYWAIKVGNTVVATGSTPIDFAAIYLVEFHHKVADTGGLIELRVNGNLEVTYSGDTKIGTAATIDQVQFYSGRGYYDDIAVNDTNGTTDNSWPGDGRIIGLAPNGNGDFSQLTGSDGNSTDNYLLVDEIPPNSDTDFVEGVTANLYDLYQLANTGLSNISIKRVYLEARAKETVAAGGMMQLGIKSGATEDWSNDIPLSLSYAAYKGKDYPLNPATGLPWTVPEIDSLQAGFKVR